MSMKKAFVYILRKKNKAPPCAFKFMQILIMFLQDDLSGVIRAADIVVFYTVEFVVSDAPQYTFLRPFQE